jgi:hypothetical protein
MILSYGSIQFLEIDAHSSPILNSHGHKFILFIRNKSQTCLLGNYMHLTNLLTVGYGIDDSLVK